MNADQLLAAIRSDTLRIQSEVFAPASVDLILNIWNTPVGRIRCSPSDGPIVRHDATSVQIFTGQVGEAPEVIACSTSLDAQQLARDLAEALDFAYAQAFSTNQPRPPSQQVSQIV